MLPETLEPRKKPVTIIHHAANCGHNEPPGSLSALERCLASGAAVVEIDLIPTADGHFALLHDPNLEEDTTGTGKAPQMKRAQIESLTYKVNGKTTPEKIGFLEGAVALLKDHPDTKRLQLDLKPFTPLTQGVLRQFTTLINPVRDRIQVTSPADWAVRSLSRFAPDLSLGFDPLLYSPLPDGDRAIPCSPSCRRGR